MQTNNSRSIHTYNGYTSFQTTELISKLSYFDEYPFNPNNEQKQAEITSDIQKNGLNIPIMVDTEFNIIDGRSRVLALKSLGVDKISCNIKKVDYNQAILLMISSNMKRREEILPSEKARAYQMKLTALASQGQRKDLTCVQNGHKLKGKKSRQIIAENENISSTTAFRYLRLNNLISNLIQKVDDKQLSLSPAAIISFLTIQEQQWLYDNLSREEHFGISVAQANILKKESQKGTLTYEFIDNMLVDENRKQIKAIKLNYIDIAEYFEPDTPQEMCITRIKEALEFHKRMTAGNKKPIVNDERLI